MDLTASLGTLTNIVKKLRGTENSTFEALDTLSNILIYGTADFSHLPIGDLCKTLVHILRTTGRMKHKEMAALCIYNVIDTYPGSSRYFLQNGVLRVIDHCISNTSTTELIDNCISALSLLCSLSPESVVEQIGINCLLRCFDKVCAATQRTSLKSILSVVIIHVRPKFIDEAPELVKIAANGDENSCLIASQCFINIVENTDNYRVLYGCFKDILKATEKLSDGSAVVSMLCIISSMINNDGSASLFTGDMDFFDIVCFNEATVMKRTEIAKSILDIVMNAIASPERMLPRMVWKYGKNSSRESKKFAADIQPFLIKLFKSRTQDEETLLMALAASCCHSPFTADDEFVTIIVGLSQNKSLVPYILAFLLNMKNIKPFVDCGLLGKISDEGQPKQCKQWIGKTLAFLRKKAGITNKGNVDNFSITKISSVDDIIKVAKSNLTPFELVSKGTAQLITKFLRSHPMKTPSKELTEALQCLADSMNSVLRFTQFPSDSDPIAPDVESFSDFCYPIDIKYEDYFYEDINVDLTADLVAIESFVNQQVFPKVNKENLQKTMQKGEMANLIHPADNVIESCSVFGYLARSFNLPGYKRFTFSLNGKQFPAQEPLWHVLSTVYSSIDELLDSKPLFILNPGDCTRPSRTTHGDIPEGYDIPLQLLSAIHRVCPEVDCVSKQLTDTIIPHLSTPSLTTGLFSGAIYLFYNYPFLFTFESRFLAFKISSFDIPFALHTITTTFNDPNDKRRLNSMRMKIHANRDNILEDGIKVLAKVPPTVRIEAEFVGENGVGVGPTQEFYTLLSREFCRPSVGLWRNEDPKSEFCYGKKGLFPSPTASPKDMRLFGILCARSLAASCLIDAPLSTAFFKALDGERITVEDVDEEFARSLKQKEGLIGLDFTYPGIPSLELKKGGSNIDVTEENVDEYVQLVTNYTVGNKLRNILDAFKQGFSTVISFDSVDLFDYEEINTVLCGAEEEWTIESLRQNVEVEHGYCSDSKEINMLFEVLSEMKQKEKMLFLKFVTGSTKLPIGGLGALRPKLTVARKDDNDAHLPSVMTCTNYFKMPAYSKKEIMVEKILQAISEGQGDFSFS